MKFVIATAAAWTTATIALGGTIGAWAQTGGKAHKKPPALVAETNRVVRSDYGISYVMPEGYFDHPHSDIPGIYLEGPRTTSFVSSGQFNAYIVTAIRIIHLPTGKMKASDMTYTADDAKQLLDTINKAGMNHGNPLNYQNSAKIEVAGHPALAVLCGSSSSVTTDRALIRLVILRHREYLDIFMFQALDAEFETRVPSFEKFMGSLKFLQPNTELPTGDQPAAPVNIQISK